MEMLSTILLLASIIVFGAGMIKPHIILRGRNFGNYKDRLVILGISFIILIVAIILSPDGSSSSYSSSGTSQSTAKADTTRQSKELFKALETAIERKNGDKISELLPQITDEKIQQRAYVELYTEYMGWIAKGIEKDKMPILDNATQNSEYVNRLSFLDNVHDYRVKDLKKVKHAINEFNESTKKLNAAKQKYPKAKVLPGLLDAAEQVVRLDVYVQERLTRRLSRVEELVSGAKFENTNQFIAGSYTYNFGMLMPDNKKQVLIEFTEDATPKRGVMNFYALYVGVETLTDANGFELKRASYKEVRPMDIEYSVIYNNHKIIVESSIKTIKEMVDAHKKENKNNHIAELGAYAVPLKKFTGEWLNSTNPRRIGTFNMDEIIFYYDWAQEHISAPYKILDMSADENGNIILIIEYKNTNDRPAILTQDKLVYSTQNATLTRYSNINLKNAASGGMIFKKRST